MPRRETDECRDAAGGTSRREAEYVGTGYIQTSPTGHDYELFAESTGGVAYNLNATAWVNRRGAAATGNGQYYFAPINGQVLQPASVQPAGLAVNFNETVGVVRFKFGTDATCATPVTVQRADLFTSWGFNEVTRPTDHFFFFVRGGTEIINTLVYYTGTDPYLDLITHFAPVDMAPPADGFQDICIVVPHTDPTALGRIATPYQVPGHAATPLANTSYATAGSHQALRYTHVTGASTLGDPTTWLRFPNLPADNLRLECPFAAIKKLAGVIKCSA